MCNTTFFIHFQGLEKTAAFYKMLDVFSPFQFEMDFKMLYPNARSVDNWKSYYLKIMEIKRSSRDEWIRNTINTIEEAEDEGKLYNI